MTDHPIMTERLTLRPFVEADGPRVVDLLNDLRVSRWLARVPHPFTAADLRINGPDGESRWPDLMAIEWQGAVVGAVGGGARLGYWLTPPVWGQGIATEAARAAVTYSFAHLGHTEITSGYLIGNDASRALLTRLVFQETGLTQERIAAREGLFDHMGMRLAREDWEAAQ